MSPEDQRADGGTTPSVARLRAIATDARAHPPERASAIISLSRQGEIPSVEADAPAAVRSALGRATEVLRARELVAGYEAGKALEQLPRPRTAAAPRDSPTIEVFRVADTEIRRIMAIAARPLREAPHVVGLRCAGRDLALLLATERLHANTLLRDPTRLGQVAVHHTEETDVWTVPFNVLTQPTDGALHVAVLDDRGRARFIGDAKTAANGLEFSVHAVQAPGVTPVTIEGTLTDERMTVTSARSARKAFPARAPLRSAPGQR